MDVAAKVPFVAIVGGRMRAARFDTYTNLLRTTLGGVAATVGCADVIAVEPFELQPSRQGADARRLARRQLQLLRDESFLDIVADPGGGARQLEDLTDQLARKALDSLRELEAGGGLRAGLDSADLNGRLRRAKAHREVAMRTGERALLGINRFADPGLETPAGMRHAGSPTPNTAEDVLRRTSTDGFAFERLREALGPILPQPVELWCCGDYGSLRPSVARARDGLRALGWSTPPEPLRAETAADLPELAATTKLLLIASDEAQCTDATARLSSAAATTSLVWLDASTQPDSSDSWRWSADGDVVLALARITRQLLNSTGHGVPDDIQTWCSLDATNPEQFLTTITESDA